MSSVESNVVYGMYSGLALLLDIYRPQSANGFGVVHVAGSGWHSPLAYNAAPLKSAQLIYPQALQAAGYTVFSVNHRAAPRFRYPAAVEDVQRAVRFVRHHAEGFGIRPDRIGAAGGSSGGHLVSMLGVLGGAGDLDDPDPVNRESARVQCVVARAAPCDLGHGGVGGAVASFLGMIPRGGEAEGALSTELKTYRDASPINHVSKGCPPFLLIHGDADATVPFQQSLSMEEALRREGVPVRLLRVEGGGHGPEFPGAEDPPDYLGAMVQWFDEQLKAG